MISWPIGDTRMGEPWRFRWPAPWARDLAFALVVGAWIGALGPFDNFGAGPLYKRIAFHLVLAMIVLVAFRTAIGWAVRKGNAKGIPSWISGAIAIAATCLPLSLAVGIVGIVFFPQLRRILSPIDWCVETTVLYMPIACGYAGLIHTFTRKPMPPPMQTAPRHPASVASPRLQSRFPPAVSGAVMALQVEDHYVRIHTPSGSHLVLMRLSDAIREMDGVDGIKVHRSWWVARTAVSDVRLETRSGRLILANGLQVPVARSALVSVKTAGWR